MGSMPSLAYKMTGAAPRRLLTYACLVALLAAALIGCGRGGTDLPDVRMHLALAPDPPQLGPAQVTVMLAGAQGEPIAGAEVELEGNMHHAL